MVKTHRASAEQHAEQHAEQPEADQDNRDPSSYPMSLEENPSDLPNIGRESLRVAQIEEVRTLPSAALAIFRDTPAPSPKQLEYANTFFISRRPTLLFSTPRLLHMPYTSIPEVAFLGRSNVGKSSLLNALMRTDTVRTSHKPGFTKTMNAFAIGATPKRKSGLLNVLDMPGYGKGSHSEWGTEIQKYLSGRKELKRVFVLVDSTHWLKKTDIWLLDMLRESRIPHQVVLSKIDRLIFKTPGKTRPPITPEKLAPRMAVIQQKLREMDETQSAVPDTGSSGERVLKTFGQVIACAAESGKFKYLGEPRLGALGMDNLRWAVLQACGLAPRVDELEATKKKKGGGTGEAAKAVYSDEDTE
ncbi:MAG: hypothetical protein LQ340_003592 [Diploschistes diacapsis]|nr:MAG: hypothetical protein LQ340_003592 [Diploschistes diacapsis]